MRIENYFFILEFILTLRGSMKVNRKVLNEKPLLNR